MILTTFPGSIPGRLRTLLRDCLVRDPRQRLRDIGDARIVLEQVLAGTPDDGPASASPAAPVVSAAQRILPWVAAAILSVALGVALWAPWRRAETTGDRPLLRLDVDLGADVSLPEPTASGASLTISPDGTRVAYLSGTPARLFTRRLDQPKATELTGTLNATAPSFSPDGQWLLFAAGRKLNKISVEGGAVVPLADLDRFTGASWGEDGSIIAASFEKGLVRIRGAEPPEVLTTREGSELGLARPQILPGGRAVLFAADNFGMSDKTTIQAITLADRQKKVVVRGGASPRYVAAANGAGYLLYVTKATLFAVPFDPGTLETRGTAVPVVDDVAHDDLVGSGQFDVSRTGLLLYRRTSGTGNAMKMVQWVDPARSETVNVKPAAYREIRVSPDGKRIALSITAENKNVWIYDAPRDVITRVTFGGTNSFPAWSPDGQFLVFYKAEPGDMGLWQARADGATQPQMLLPTNRGVSSALSFTPDGKRLAYVQGPLTLATQIWTLPLDTSSGRLNAGTPEPFPASGSVDAAPAFSPDGRWLAYQSNESGTNEVYVRAFPPSSSGPGGKWQISNGGGSGPRWSPNGRDLVYQSGGQIMAASYTASGLSFVAEKPRVWIATAGAPENATQWDLAPDGKRVVVLKSADSGRARSEDHEVVFFQNFVDELRRRVPLPR